MSRRRERPGSAAKRDACDAGGDRPGAEAEARAAQGRVMQETIDEMHKKKERRRSQGRKR